MRYPLIPLTLIIFDAVSLALVRNFCTLLRDIWTLDGLAGLRISQDYRACAASKDNQSHTDGECVNGGDLGLPLFWSVLPPVVLRCIGRSLLAASNFPQFTINTIGCYWLPFALIWVTKYRITASHVTSECHVAKKPDAFLCAVELPLCFTR